jgi:hypothetical protein
MDLHKALAQTREMITLSESMWAAHGRARAERDDADKRAQAAENALTKANVDRLVDGGGDVDLDALRRDAERARSESLLGERSVRDVHQRLKSGANDLGNAKVELERALAAAFAQERAAVAALARDALTPLSAKLADLEKLSAEGWHFHGSLTGTIGQALVTLTEHAKGPAAAPTSELDLTLVQSCQQAARELAALEAGIREQLAAGES